MCLKNLAAIIVVECLKRVMDCNYFKLLVSSAND